MEGNKTMTCSGKKKPNSEISKNGNIYLTFRSLQSKAGNASSRKAVGKMFGSDGSLNLRTPMAYWPIPHSKRKNFPVKTPYFLP